MSAYELSVALVCAIVGYVVISALWPTKKSEQKTQPETEEARTSERHHQEQSRTGTDGRSDNHTDRMAWHEVLEVSPMASLAEIKQAYREKVAKYHPDKVAQMGPELHKVANEMTAKINNAYEIGCRNRR